MRSLIVVVVLALLAVPVVAQNRPPALLDGVHRVVCLGDSITEQGGQKGGYVWLLQRYLTALYPSQGIEVVNAGISGHKATDMQARFQRDVVDKKPDLVTISVGVNDVWHGFYDNHPKGDGPRGVPVELYREKVTQMIDAAKAVGAKVVLVSPTLIYENIDSPENAKLMRYIGAMRSMAAEHGCGFVDLNAAFREVIRAYQKRAGHGLNLLTTDGVHMNPAGNRLMTYTLLRGMGITDKDLAGVTVN